MTSEGPYRPSLDSPLRVDFLPPELTKLRGGMGMTLPPGKRGAGLEGPWARDLTVVDMMIALVERILASARAGETVVVHCKGGLGRTGTAAACCLAALGYEAARAIAIVRAARPGTVEPAKQERFIEAFASTVIGSRARRPVLRSGPTSSTRAPEWVDAEVIVDDGLVTSRKPDELQAFNAKMIEDLWRGP